MRHALGLPLSDATLETWAQHFCFELEPLFVDAALKLNSSRTHWC